MGKSFRSLSLLSLSCLLATALLSALPAAGGDAAAGKAMFGVCTACHGPLGVGNQAMNGPKLTGQEDWYLLRQMQLFQSGARGAAPGDMQGMVMAGIAKGPMFKSPESLANLTAYIVSLDDAPAATTVTGDVEKGAALYVACAACHGKQAEGMETMAGPRLAGQSDWYMVSQLKKFKAGQRGYDDADHTGRQMKLMVATLADDQAIADVVAYINTLGR